MAGPQLSVSRTWPTSTNNVVMGGELVIPCSPFLGSVQSLVYETHPSHMLHGRLDVTLPACASLSPIFPCHGRQSRARGSSSAQPAHPRFGWARSHAGS